jgi:hypothetical protein
MSEEKKVWIGSIANRITQKREAVEAKYYQEESYNAFMSTFMSNPFMINHPHIMGLSFLYDQPKRNGYNGPIRFRVEKFDKEKFVKVDNYSRFCVYINEYNQMSILSDNYDDLVAYIKADEDARMEAARQNSLQRSREAKLQGSMTANSTGANSMPRRTGGNRTKRSRKTKRSKRVHTSKRK